MDDKKVDDTTEFDSKSSKFHSLFREKIKEVQTKVIVDGEELYKIIPEHIKHRMFISYFDEGEDKGLHEIFNILWSSKENDTLELRIHSQGGSLQEGRQFYNLIKNKFKGRTTTVLDTMGYSMGALLFCMGDKRIIMEHSDFMLHDYSSWSMGKGQEIESHIEHNRLFYRNFFKKVLVNTNFLTKKEFEQMIIGKDYWMSIKDLCKRNIATHVLDNGELIDSPLYLKSI